MAGSIIGGALFSAAMQVLLDRAVPGANFFVGLFRRSEQDAAPLRANRSEQDAAPLRAKLSHLMMIIKSMMDDAEENRVTNCAVEKLLNELKNALYDGEDLLDEIDDEDRRWKGESGSRILPPMSPETSDEMRDQIWPRQEAFSRTSPVPSDGKSESITVKLEEFSRRVDYLVRQMNVMSSKKHVKGKSAARLPSTDIPDEDRISGREEERRRIIEFLQSREGSRRRISVVAIAGMPGVGKTTLAQHVYNDEILRDFFDIKVWVCVSNDFDVVRVTKTIHESVSSWLFESEDLNIVQKDLSGRLIEKKVLLVLDDLWSEDYDKWDALLKPFKMVAEGSAVLITTRHESVAKVSNPDLTLHLEQLSDEDCWSIIKTHAFSQMDLAVNLKREVLGRKIARKCGGLPLAAKAVGRLLRSTKEDEWELILEHDLWYSVNDKSSILPALQLSYRYLPSHLKRCFSYCSMFPKDYQFEKKNLILLWMAEGFVQHPSDGRSIEEEGDRYFSELLSRSFFQQSSSSVSSFIMHDLFHDLAKMESKEFISRVASGKSCKIPEKVRHFSFRRRRFDDLTKWKPFKSFSHLHTFMPIDYPAVYNFVNHRALRELLPALRCVRVLCLSHYLIYHLPDEIGELQQLRFLDLSFTSLKNLPETICKLHKLETLLLNDCCNLMNLPSNFCNLTSLRHLDLTKTVSLRGMPQGIGSLSSLRTLSKFVVGPYDPSDHDPRREDITIDVLGSYQHLQGDLCISNMDRVRSKSDATSARLANLKNLEGLKLEWGNQHNDSKVEREVLDLIKPSKTLKRLAIQGYGGTTFPDWIGHCMYSNIVSLHLEGCEFCFVLPPLGQLQSLKKLSVEGFIQVTTVGPEFYGCDSSSIIPFRSLETLTFRQMPRWKEWFPIEGDGRGFPCLQELELTLCPELLQWLPTHLPSLKKLAISSCPKLVTLPPSHRLSPSLTCLEFLSLRATGKLLPQVLLQLTSLKALNLSHCPTMKLLPFTRLPRMLETLQVCDCRALQSLPEGFVHTNIQELVIYGCPDLKSFPIDGLPTSLKSLKVKGCRHRNFFSLGAATQKPTLKILEIEGICDSLGSFPLEFFPDLRHLKISWCENLESLCISDGLDRNLPSLEYLHISDCPKLVSLPKGRIPTPNLREFTISNCPKLKLLSTEMFTDLTSLENFTLSNCPDLEPLVDRPWLPENLISLSITHIILPSDALTRELQRLTSLKRLKIDGLNVESFPEEDLLPSTLTALTISRFPNLKFLDSIGLQKLSSLEELTIIKCPNLRTLDEGFPPPSLLCLQTAECPLGREMWFEKRLSAKIAYIPCVINGYAGF